MENEKQEVSTPVEEGTTQKFRKLVVETDGNRIKISLNETTGLLELKAILTELLTSLRS